MGRMSFDDEDILEDEEGEDEEDSEEGDEVSFI